MKFAKAKYLHWYVTGFVDGEGCFSVSIKRQKGTRFGYVIDPVFHVVQRDCEVLNALKQVFQAGRVEKKHGQEEYQYVVDNRRQLSEKVIPFFKKHKLMVKRKDFELFASIVADLEAKKHFTLQGFKALLKKAYKLTKQKRSLEEILKEIEAEALRDHTPGPCLKGEKPKSKV